MNQNAGHAFNIPVNGGAHSEIYYHHDAFFTPKANSFYDAFGLLTADIETKLYVLEEKMKVIQGSNTFRLDVSDIFLVPSVKIPTKFKVPVFENYNGVSYPKTHIRSF